MDPDVVVTIGDAAVLAGTYVAAAAGGGVVGNAAYDGLRGVAGWFRHRGVEPEPSWVEGPLPEATLAGIGEVDAGTHAELVELLALAQVEVGSIGGNHAQVVGDNSRVTQIGTVSGPFTIN